MWTVPAEALDKCRMIAPLMGAVMVVVVVVVMVMLETGGDASAAYEAAASGASLFPSGVSCGRGSEAILSWVGGGCRDSGWLL